MNISDILSIIIQNWSIAHNQNFDDLVENLLSAKINELCPDCHGDGFYSLPEWEGKEVECHHDLAPTIRKLLNIGHVVMLTKIPQKNEISDWADGYLTSLQNLQSIKD